MSLAKFINYPRVEKTRLLMAGAILTSIASPVFLNAGGASAATFSDFSFGSGIPFTGNTTVDGVSVNLTSTNTEPFGATAFRDNTSSNTATINFSFDQNITEFVLDVSFVNVGEFLTNFNIGTPTSLTGDLILDGSNVTTNRTDDSGAGLISFTNINTNTISFNIETVTNAALAVNEFGIAAVAESVPEPSLEPLTILGVGSFLGFGASFKRKLANRKNKTKTNS